MDNKEIELKFIITKEQREEIFKELANYAKLTASLHQIDTYYIPEFKSFEINGETKECLRIRECNDKFVLCYKNIHRESDPVYCDEYETEIENKEQMENILFSLGFKVQMVIDKIRFTYLYKNFEIDFDTVNENVEFLEVELKDDNSTVEDILDYVSKYGLTKDDVTYEGIQKIMQRLS